jgi:hypothetical protein
MVAPSVMLKRIRNEALIGELKRVSDSAYGDIRARRMRKRIRPV